MTSVVEWERRRRERLDREIAKMASPILQEEFDRFLHGYGGRTTAEIRRAWRRHFGDDPPAGIVRAVEKGVRLRFE